MDRATTGAKQDWQPPRRGRVWDTADVADRDAFGYYRDGICEAFMELAPERAGRRSTGFRARIESSPVGIGAVNRVDATSHLVRRTSAEIARAPSECFYLNLQRGGECRIGQAGSEIALRRGDVGIFDSTVPFELSHARHPSLAVSSFWVPRQPLLDRLPNGTPPLATVLSDHPALGHLIRETAALLSERPDDLAPEDADRLFDLLLDLAALALGGTRSPRIENRDNLDAGLALAVRRFIERNLRRPELSVHHAAHEFGVSARYVQMAMERDGTTFGRHLLTRRLEMAAADLLSPSLRHLPVTTVALDAGFSDLSHFTRAFKRRFDRPPGAWRRDGSRPT